MPLPCGSAPTEWEPADAPSYLAEMRHLQVVEHNATGEHRGVAVEVEADILDGQRAQFLADSQAIAFAGQRRPLDRPEEALHDSRVFVAIDAHECDVERGHGVSVHLTMGVAAGHRSPIECSAGFRLSAATRALRMRSRGERPSAGALASKEGVRPAASVTVAASADPGKGDDRAGQVTMPVMPRARFVGHLQTLHEQTGQYGSLRGCTWNGADAGKCGASGGIRTCDLKILTLPFGAVGSCRRKRTLCRENAEASSGAVGPLWRHRRELRVRREYKSVPGGNRPPRTTVTGLAPLPAPASVVLAMMATVGCQSCVMRL